MARTNTQRIERLEDCYRELKEEVAGEFVKLKDWMANGFSGKQAWIITVKLAEHQAREWEREREERRLQLEEQKEANRLYGQQRDAERLAVQAKADHRTKILIACISVGGPALTAIVTWLLTRGSL